MPFRRRPLLEGFEFLLFSLRCWRFIKEISVSFPIYVVFRLGLKRSFDAQDAIHGFCAKQPAPISAIIFLRIKDLEQIPNVLIPR